MDLALSVNVVVLLLVLKAFNIAYLIVPLPKKNSLWFNESALKNVIENVFYFFDPFDPLELILN